MIRRQDAGQIDPQAEELKSQEASSAEGLQEKAAELENHFASREAIRDFVQSVPRRKKRGILPSQLAQLDHRCFSWKRDRGILLGAFLLPFALMLLVYACLGFYPVGDRSPLTVDLYHQYVPFLSALRDKLLHGEGFFYSWMGGLGYNFLANFAYYAASPLNLLLPLFPKTSLPLFVTLVELLKFGFMGLTAALFFRVAVAKTEAERAAEALEEQDSEELAELLPPGGYLEEPAMDSNTMADFLAEPEEKRERRKQKKAKQAKVSRANRRFDPQQRGILIASLFYALSGFAISYSWNIMWMDVLVFFPLVLLGLHRLVNRGSAVVYTLSLAACLFVNYYMAFFVCIFSVLYFFYLLAATRRGFHPLRREKTGKLFLLRGLQMLVYSLLAGGMSAVLLLPVYRSLQMTSGVSDTFPTSYSMAFSLLEFFSRHLIGMSANIRSGLPNIFCGLLTLLALPLYLGCKKIRFSEKLASLTLWFFLFLSLNSNVLNFLWHGMHYPNQIPHRFAFVYVLFTLVLLFRVLQHLHALEPRWVVISAAAVSLYLVLAEVLLKEEVRHELIYLNLFFVLLYGAILLKTSDRLLTLRSATALLLLLAMGESLFNVAFLSVDIAKNEVYASYSSYVEKMKPVDRMKEELLRDDPGFYRMEISDRMTGADPALYNLRGLSIFSSTTYKDMAKLMRNLGYEGNNINSYAHEEATALTDMLFGIRYLFRSEVRVDPTLEEMQLLSAFPASPASDPNEDRRLTVAEAAVSPLKPYRRCFTLPIGFRTDKLLPSMPSAGDAFSNQNELLQSFSADLKPVIYSEDLREVKRTNFSSGRSATSGKGLHFTPTNTEETAELTLELTAQADGQLYLYLDPSSESYTLTATSNSKREKLETTSPSTTAVVTEREEREERDEGDETSASRIDNKKEGDSGQAVAESKENPDASRPVTEPQPTSSPAPVLSEKTPALNRSLTVSKKMVYDLGYVEEGEGVKLHFRSKENKSSNLDVWAGLLSPERLVAAREKLASESFAVEAYNSNTLQGKIDVKTPGQLFFSIPYDPSWKITVDGREVPAEKTAGAFLSLPIQEGRHQVNLVFTPEGFSLGWKISLGSFVAFLLFSLIGASLRRREAEAEE